jgi:hypothetical protein
MRLPPNRALRWTGISLRFIPARKLDRLLGGGAGQACITMAALIWTRWNNGKHHSTGAGYGLKVTAAGWRRPAAAGPRYEIQGIESVVRRKGSCR